MNKRQLSRFNLATQYYDFFESFKEEIIAGILNALCLSQIDLQIKETINSLDKESISKFSEDIYSDFFCINIREKEYYLTLGVKLLGTDGCYALLRDADRDEISIELPIATALNGQMMRAYAAWLRNGRITKPMAEKLELANRKGFREFMKNRE